MTDVAAAYDALRSRAESGNFGMPIVWREEDNQALPDTPAPFVYFEIDAERGRVVELGGGRGNNRYRNGGELVGYVFVPRGSLQVLPRRARDVRRGVGAAGRRRGGAGASGRSLAGGELRGGDGRHPVPLRSDRVKGLLGPCRAFGAPRLLLSLSRQSLASGRAPRGPGGRSSPLVVSCF
jgi:hypothetical protein